MLVLTNGISSVGAAGIWLISLGFVWTGSTLIAVMFGTLAVAIWRMDRTVLRQMAPVLWLGGAVIAAIVVIEVSSWLEAPRAVQMRLLGAFVVLAAVFLVWGTVSTSRRMWAAYRIGRTPGARPQA